jgi:hypothetical protein
MSRVRFHLGMHDRESQAPLTLLAVHTASSSIPRLFIAVCPLAHGQEHGHARGADAVAIGHPRDQDAANPPSKRVSARALCSALVGLCAGSGCLAPNDVFEAGLHGGSASVLSEVDGTAARAGRVCTHLPLRVALCTRSVPRARRVRRLTACPAARLPPRLRGAALRARHDHSRPRRRDVSRALAAAVTAGAKSLPETQTRRGVARARAGRH